MQYYLAPLEGVTSFIYRRTFHKYYGKNIDKYFIPFIETHIKRDFNARERNDLLPEHNEGMFAVPQVLTKSAADYLFTEKSLLDFGYREINLNLGCPSGTVVSNGRGAGMLKDPEQVDRFLYDIFSGTNAKLSVKTRIGSSDPDEFPKLLEIYNKYPLQELIVHPRCQKQLYKGSVSLSAFSHAMTGSDLSLCYNGDITSAASLDLIRDTLSSQVDFDKRCHAVMLGRGLIANPDLLDTVNNKEPDPSVFRLFHDELLDSYCAFLSGDKNVLFRMKELWSFWEMRFLNHKKEIKNIRKSQTVAQYRAATRHLL